MFCLNDQPIGCAGLEIYEEGQLKIAKLTWFGIIPTYQGKGFGGYFLQELFQIAQKESVQECKLNVHGANTKALSFYKKH